tara:strand:- start:1585 stop:2094 length:510 start_codon:yes stop_codon:yes gene_type:complete
MSYVVAIDVGVKNLSLCVYDFLCNQVVHWANVSLTHGRYLPAHNVQYVRDFVNSQRRYFDGASMVVVERQMRCNMRIIESVLQTLFFDRCVVISPRSVKAHYGLSTRNYRANKVKAVEWAQLFVANNPTIFANSTSDTFVGSRKKDDLADSLLLVMYYLDTYSNQIPHS